MRREDGRENGNNKKNFDMGQKNEEKGKQLTGRLRSIHALAPSGGVRDSLRP